MIIFEILPALLFILSSGLLFNERFRNNKALVAITGCVAIIASYFLAEQILDRMIASRLTAHFDPTSEPTRETTLPSVTPPSSQPRRNEPAQQVPITTQEIERTFQTYIAAWQAGDLASQANLLDPTFSYIDQEHVRQSRSAYLRQKQDLAAKYRASPFSANIRIGVTNVSFETRGDVGSVSYDQTYESPFYSSFGRNRFVMRKRGTVVTIVEEIFDRRRFVRRDPNQPSG